MAKRIKLWAAISGLMAVVLFVSSFIFFGMANPDFDFVRDFISKLGSKGQPYANWWNFVGFAVVGLLLAAYGWLFGLCRNDRVLGVCLLVAGIGFALASIPTDFAEPQSALSAAHFVSICFSLAGFCLGLSRLTGSRASDDDRLMANWVVALAIIPIVCVSGGVSAEPVAHRVILLVVFTWVVINSLRLLRKDTAAELAG